MFNLIFGSGSSWFWEMMQFFALSISLFFIYRQIRIQRQTNMLQAIHKMDDRWNSIEMVKSRMYVCKNRLNQDVSVSDSDDMVLIFFEDMGIYRKRDIFDKELVWDTYSFYIEFYWPMLVPKIKEQWAGGDETIYSNFKALYDETIKLTKQKEGYNPIKKSQEVEGFARGEIERFKNSVHTVNLDVVNTPVKTKRS